MQHYVMGLPAYDLGDWTGLTKGYPRAVLMLLGSGTTVMGKLVDSKLQHKWK